jgi:hypothetical protein
MKKHLKKLLFGTFITVLIISMSGCTSLFSTETGTTETVTEESTDVEEVSVSTDTEIYTEYDLDDSYDESTATLITLSDSSVDISGEGASSDGTTVTITAEGTYIISGSTSDGQIVVNAGEDADVQIVLDDASITCSDGPAIYEIQADKTKITLAEGSSNTLSDSSSYSDTSDEAPNATVYATNDLTFNGSGTLTINGNYYHAVNTKDDLRITGGTYIINSVEEGLRGHDSVAILTGDFTIDAGGDGIKSDQEDSTDKGWIIIDGGTYSITAVSGGIQAQTYLTINGGEFDITATGDALHSSGDITIIDGSITLSSGDDGVHADDTLSIEGGALTVTDSYEGLEAAYIYISGGDTTVYAQDDGLNAAGGNDSTNSNPQDNFSSSGDYLIDISGGNLNIIITSNQDTDGIDSNGSISISGGTTYLSTPGGILDSGDSSDSTISITGGTFVAAGSTSMFEAPDSASQGVAIILYTSTQSSGTDINVSDSSGNSLASFTPENSYTCVIVSSPEMSSGSTYTLSSGGTTLCDFTLDDTISYFYSDGSSYTGSSNNSNSQPSNQNTPGNQGGGNKQSY